MQQNKEGRERIREDKQKPIFLGKEEEWEGPPIIVTSSSIPKEV